jgi:hypothetical protein
MLKNGHLEEWEETGRITLIWILGIEVVRTEGRMEIAEDSLQCQVLVSAVSNLHVLQFEL